MKEKIYFKDFMRMCLLYKKHILIILSLATMFMVQISLILPKKYKSTFELNVYTKYFKNALYNDIVPGMNSIQEMTQTIDSMIKESLNDKFIDEIGNEFNIYKKNLNERELSVEREKLRQNFELYGTGAQSYRITFTNSNPVTTFNVTQKVLTVVKENFIHSKLDTIETAQKAIIQKLKSATGRNQISSNSVLSNALASRNTSVLRSEMIKINSDLSSLKMQFNMSHPLIVKLEQRKLTIEKWLKDSGNNDGNDIKKNNESIYVKDDESIKYSDDSIAISENQETSQDITRKLYSKYNDISIALDIERKTLDKYIGIIVAPQVPTSAIFPQKKIFASLGFLMGLVGCFIYVFLKEFIKLTPAESVKKIADDFNYEYFGAMPYVFEDELMTNKVIILKNSNSIEGKYESDKVK